MYIHILNPYTTQNKRIKAIMKQILINDNEPTQSNLIDFINYNIDGLTFEEINKLNKLKVNQGVYINSVQIIRTK